ncbi:aminotransferase class I/II-fold pyridoxal phosphate-dependent enzyme [Salinisphaera orenii]|uniref:Transcriptional regulator n=1 Tax=Salinisphaera orenii YIM 95161 TaxID=1051139 RepID=A0A423Q606_9GAMM|nr:aminotransferase class I/II-fold pyridoxal phosphate-dependent enzyme [Salinisphaera halophila]ROO34941.1 transcriptional regulator [Salinisphaera halophila YIM 95161]
MSYDKMKIQGSTTEEIVASIRSSIGTGVFRPGDHLPVVRQLAIELGVNRNTAAAAYRRLTEARLVVSEGRRGTRIAAPPSAGEQEGLSAHTTLIDWADGNPDPACLPDMNQIARKCEFVHALYGEDTLDAELRRYATAWFCNDCPSDDFGYLVTHGCVDAIERLARAQLLPGDQVAVEDPCYLGTINALRLSGMHPRGVSIDGAGIRPDALRSALENGARAVLITARAQNPTGASLTSDRAREIAQVLADYPDVLVIVDDHFALLAATPYRSPIPESTTRWAVIRSLAKALGPDIRLALLACDAATAGRLQARLAPGMTWVSHFLQTLASHCLNSSEIEQTLERAKAQYAHGRNELMAALSRHAIEAPVTIDGLNVWIPLPCDAEYVVNAMAKRGWLVRSSTAYDVQKHNQAIRVTISRVQQSEIMSFSTDLSSVIRTRDRNGL